MIGQMTTRENVIAGIVTYNPEIERLKENINALFEQVDSLVIVDNGSNNISNIELICAQIENKKISLIKNDTNEGIATALAQIMEFASENSYIWVLTLDQDSVIQSGLIPEYLSVANNERNSDVAMLTCLIQDRNFRDKKNENQKCYLMDLNYCITSAAFTNVAKYNTTKGYDKQFFIDCVDFDICYSLREAGYRIVRVNCNGLFHEVGHGENKKFLWKEIVVYHQAPIRVYYFARNIIWMHKKHRHYFGFFAMIKKLFALQMRIVLYEDDKINKMKSFFKGLHDAKKYKKT